MNSNEPWFSSIFHPLSRHSAEKLDVTSNLGFDSSMKFLFSPHFSNNSLNSSSIFLLSLGIRIIPWILIGEVFKHFDLSFDLNLFDCKSIIFWHFKL